MHCNSCLHPLSYQYPQQSSEVGITLCYKIIGNQRSSMACSGITQQRQEILICSPFFFLLLTWTWLAFCFSGIWGPSAIRRRPPALPRHRLAHSHPGFWLAGPFVSVWQISGEKAAPGTVQAAKLFGMKGLKLTFFEWSQLWETQIKTRILQLWSVGISGHFSQHMPPFSF